MAASQNSSQEKAEARDARIENDPAHWKRMYHQLVEREKARKRGMLIGTFIACGIVVAVVVILELFNFD